MDKRRWRVLNEDGMKAGNDSRSEMNEACNIQEPTSFDGLDGLVVQEG